MAEIYKHTQVATFIIVPVEIAMLAALYFFITTRQLPALLLLILFLGMTYLFFALTIVGTQDTLEVRFGAGLIKKRFRIKEIISAQPYRTTFWQGWGIHYCSDGLILNVSGYDAIQLTMMNGGKYIIGTNDRSRLLSFIEEYRKI